MGRFGSDQTSLPRKRTDRCGVQDIKLEEAGSLDSAVLSIRRISESKGKYAHVVECKCASPLKQSLLAPQQRFYSESLDDPDGRASALRFALTTDSLLAFRSHLFGNPEPGLPLGDTSATVDGSRAVTVIQGSSNARATAYVCIRKNTLFGLWFTVAICRLQNGSLRSISFRNTNKILESGIGQVATFLRSADFKSWVYGVVNHGLACGGEAGVCRQNGEQFGKCKRCGGLEHPQCHGQTIPTDKQAFEDYLCSTCLMVEREEVLAIRLEEQGGGPEGFWSEARSVHMDTAYHACCICGCEDNELLDELVPCPCETSLAVVHPSCTEAACKDSMSPKVSARSSSLPCLICGGEGVVHNGASDQCKAGLAAASKRPGVGIKRSIQSIQASGKGAKRSRTAATNGIVKVEDLTEGGPLKTTLKKESTVHYAQVESKDTDSEKSGVALLGRRFSDAPAIVPIKKRRIQMAEVMRTPSPPPRSPSPGIQSPSPLPRSLSPGTQPRSSSPKSASPPPRSVSSRCPSPPILSPSSRCRSPPLKSPAPPPRSSSPASPSQLQRTPPPPESGSLVGDLGLEDGCGTVKSSICSPHAMKMVETKEAGLVVHLSYTLPTSPSPNPHHDDNVCKIGDEEEAITTGKECFGTEDADMVVESSEESLREGSEHSTQGSVDQGAAVGGEPQRALLNSTSGSFRDDRLHWDLNTDMAAWEDLTAQAAPTEGEVCKVMEPACLSTSAQSDDSSHDKKVEEPIEGDVKVQADEDPETDECVDYGNSDCRDVDDQDEQMMTIPQGKIELKAESAVDNFEPDNSISRDGEAACLKDEVARDNLELDKPFSREVETAAHEDAEEVQEKLGIQEEHQDDARQTEMPAAKFEKQTTLRTKATEWDHMPEEAEAEEHVDYGDSDCRDADDMGLEVEERASLALQEDSDWKAEEVIGNLEVDTAPSFEGEAVSDAGEMQENSTLQEEDVKAAAHENQQPESSLERHDTLRRTKSTGWDKLPEGFHSAEEALRAAKESSCRGRGGPWVTSGGRGSMLNSRGSVSGNRLGTGPGAHRDGFAPSRGYNYIGDRSADKLSRGRDSFSHGRRLDDGLNANSYDIGQGRKPGRGGSAAGAGIHGRGRAGRWIDTQGGSLGEWGPGRRRSTTGFVPQGHPNAAAVAAARVKSSGFVVAPDGTITKAGSAMAPGRGGIRSAIGTSRGGRGLLMNFARGPHVDLEAGLNFSARVSVGPERGMGASSNSGMKVGGRGLGPGVGPGFGGGMPDRSGSAGRRMMDRYRGPPFGSGGMDSRRSESPHRSMYPLDHQKMDNRTPPRFRPESRVERSKTPPYHTLGNSKSVAVASARGDHSPPPSSKWSGDRRETHNFRDQDYKRPISRSHMPPSRTSPHVHSSSLMDDWDRQVLEGARHSPPMRVVLNSSVSAGKSGDGSSETRRSKRDEDEDIRITGSRSKDADYDRMSPRDGDKDRDNRGNVYRRERSTEDDRRRDSKKLSTKDGRSASGHKHASTREGEDDVAPRRRRPS